LINTKKGATIWVNHESMVSQVGFDITAILNSLQLAKLNNHYPMFLAECSMAKTNKDVRKGKNV